MSRFSSLTVLLALFPVAVSCTKPDSSDVAEAKTPAEIDWYYPEAIAKAKYNEPIKVLDTDSALGRYSLKHKEIGMKDIVKIHGHPCDGLVIAYIEVKEVLKKLFPDGVVDRTDIRVVSKNGPCWVDTVAMMTGARINFETLSIDPKMGNGFVIQRISTGDAYSVHLKEGVFPEDQAALEAKIRTARAEGKEVSAADIDSVEKMHSALSVKLLNSPPEAILDIKEVPDFKFQFNFLPGKRGDIINKDAPRE